MAELNGLDFVIIFIFLGSILVGLSRGVVKEVISLLTWVAAIFVAVMFSHQLAGVFTGSSVVQSVISNTSSSVGTDTTQQASMVALGISFIILFVVTMIVGALVSSIVSSVVASVGIGFINRLLGGVFGVARGYLCALIVLFVISLTPLTGQSWWKNSQLLPSFAQAIEWLDGIVQPGLASLKASVGNTLQGVSGNISNLYQSGK